MDADVNMIVRTCSELSVGEEIEAWHKGRLFHRGRVTETIPTTDVFWIVDSRTGARKLLDVEALEIVRVEKTVAVESVRPKPVRPEPVRPEPGRAETGRAEPGRAEPARPETGRLETVRNESAHVDRAVRGERATASRASRREPHVVWFSSA